jgi:hypothetical protein
MHQKRATLARPHLKRKAPEQGRPLSGLGLENCGRIGAWIAANTANSPLIEIDY